MSDLITAPWTAEQVANLNEYQRCGMAHPYTAGHRNEDGSAIKFIATPGGWVEREGGSVVQTWAHENIAAGEFIRSWGEWLREARKSAPEGAK